MEFLIMMGMVIFAYPFNKIIRYFLKKGNVGTVSTAWLAFIILLMIQLINLSSRLHDSASVLHYMIYSIPSLVFLLITDILRTNETTLYFRFLRNRWFRWISAIFLFFILIPLFQNLIVKNTGIKDVYYLYSLVIAIVYIYFYLRKPNTIKKQNNEQEIHV